MTRQTPSSLLLIAALAGGIGFVAFVALMVVGEFTFSPAAFLAVLVALAAAIFFYQGFHKGNPTDTPELRALDQSRLGDVTRKAGTAGVAPGSAGVKTGAASGHATAASSAAPAAGAAAASASATGPARADGAAAADDPAAARTAEQDTPSAAVAAAPPPPQDAGPGAAADPAPSGAAAPEDQAKWKSTQLAGSEELAGRKGDWKYEREGDAPVPEAPPSAAAATGPDPSVGREPTRLHSPRDGGADDLKRISGVGPKLEGMLHGLGIYHFDQVAAWSDDEIDWVDEHLEGFKGRVRRDEWVRQARDLSSGDTA